MNSTKPEKNQRKYPRIPVSIGFRCGKFVNPTKFVSRDLSQGGVFISTTNVYPLDAVVDVHFSLPYSYGEIKIKGKVVRHNLDEQTGTVDGMAIEFLNLPEAEQRMISEYIKNTEEAGVGGAKSEK